MPDAGDERRQDEGHPEDPRRGGEVLREPTADPTDPAIGHAAHDAAGHHGLAHAPMITRARAELSSGTHPESGSGSDQGQIRGKPATGRGCAGRCWSHERNKQHPAPRPRQPARRAAHHGARRAAGRPGGSQAAPAARISRPVLGADPTQVGRVPRRDRRPGSQPGLRRRRCWRPAAGSYPQQGAYPPPGSYPPPAGYQQAGLPAAGCLRTSRGLPAPGAYQQPGGYPAAGAYQPPRPAPRLTRSRSQRVVGGVCGGLARYWNTDPTLLRILTVVLTLATGGAFLDRLPDRLDRDPRRAHGPLRPGRPARLRLGRQPRLRRRPGRVHRPGSPGALLPGLAGPLRRDPRGRGPGPDRLPGPGERRASGA